MRKNGRKILASLIKLLLLYTQKYKIYGKTKV
nr:MAG TPA: hypothetical protein [Caudoviricetes sp.]